MLQLFYRLKWVVYAQCNTFVPKELLNLFFVLMVKFKERLACHLVILVHQDLPVKQVFKQHVLCIKFVCRMKLIFILMALHVEEDFILRLIVLV